LEFGLAFLAASSLEAAGFDRQSTSKSVLAHYQIFLFITKIKDQGKAGLC
jgi:hypothetical protein